MSIIYDALQKTQRNREYFRLQHALTQSEPHRRNIKWMVLGSLMLMLCGGVIAIYSFYGKPEGRVTKRPPVLQPLSEKVTPPPAHLWVTDAHTVSTPPPREVLQQPAPQAVLQQPAPVQENRVIAEVQPQPALPPQVVAQPSQVAVQPATIPAQQAQPANQVVAAPANAILTNARLTLNGVLISGSEKIALINNQTFHLGDLVDGMKIVSIDATSVKLQSGAELLELRVPL